MSSPGKSHTSTRTDKPASDQPALKDADFAQFHPSVEKLIERHTGDIEPVVQRAGEILKSDTTYDVWKVHVKKDWEASTRMGVNCEIAACIVALKDSKWSARVAELCLFFETKEKDGPATEAILDIRVQRCDAASGLNDANAIPIELKARGKLQDTVTKNGKAAHQLRCEMDSLRASAVFQNVGNHRRFGVLCDDNYMFFCYTTGSSTKLHLMVVHADKRLFYLTLTILIALGFDGDFFRLAEPGEIEESRSNRDKDEADGDDEGGGDKEGGEDHEHQGRDHETQHDTPEGEDDATPPKDGGLGPNFLALGDLTECTRFLELRDLLLPQETFTRANRVLSFTHSAP